MNAVPSPRLSRAALVSLLLGLLSLGPIPLLGLTGLPALYFGLMGLRIANSSDGRIRGQLLAIIGMITGGIGTCISVLGFAAILLVQLNTTAQRATCTNHLRIIGQGLSVYHGQHDSFPPAGLLSAPPLPPEDRLSWLAGIGPFLVIGKSKQPFEDLGIQLDPSKAWNDPVNKVGVRTTVRVYLCPAQTNSVQPGQGPRGYTSYVGLAGLGADALTIPRTAPNAGMFGYDRGVSREELTAGASYTMMVTEMAEPNRLWIASGPPTARGVESGLTRYLGPDCPLGGLHPHGANVLWADSSVRWVQDTVDPNTFRRQILIHGRESQ